MYIEHLKWGVRRREASSEREMTTEREIGDAEDKLNLISRLVFSQQDGNP